MTALVVVAHAPLASALKAAAAHAFPEAAARLATLDVQPHDAPEAIEQQLRRLLADAAAYDPRHEALILCDVFGATPSNVAQRLADGLRVKVVTGVNVPMLWRALNYVHEPLETLAARALAGANQGVLVVAAARPQNQNPLIGTRPGDAYGSRQDQQ
ncbi:MAG TPA: PTS fructose transporter subunit IIA [Methylibium sp.]|uniref:PTS sugar transporter subunit IIA n=1 Tax=Methylibium sp. TaxID=2067992 RepID=UPI002DB91BA0|nr:PTS fructose transporter subunit IIA [Methylibium sp.]HEU4459014.1 PTS fructose transporter subunit IIA [Methylibium sp.]